ncbi:multifunctional CCA addition/repair protein [Shewanella sp. YIC-542]|uniref:multifunctional CCA addition/repair protein n=1 Tax=Shewanella mytili TaxID=3377111 RepID=UPI00398E7EEC
MQIFLVGGAVRDKLLGRKMKDRDYVVVGATEQQMLAQGYRQVGKDFPVFLHPKTQEEYALARTERKTGRGYGGFSCYASPDVTLEQDLLRRDLTINAIAMDENGNLHDPFHGQRDINQRILRHVSPAFVEDPLRVLRVARFAARFSNFSIAPETMEEMQQIAASGELADLTPERVWQELHSALTEDHPEIFFHVLRQANALGIIWPELDALWGIPNPASHHPEICSGEHTMLVLQQAAQLSSKTTIRFAALCHDLGKGITPPNELPSHKQHEIKGLPLVETSCNRLKVPNDHKQLALKVCQFHLHSHRALELKPTTVLALFNQLDLWRKPQEFEDFLITCEADFKGRLGHEHIHYPQADFLRLAANACQQVNAKPFIEQGLQGKAIKDAMDREKVRVIKQVKTCAQPHPQ